ncbi:MAG: transposase [Bdellovibrionia bacterium]
MKLPEPQVSKLPLFEKKPETSVFGQVRFDGMQYLTPLSDSPHLTFSNLLSARLSVLKETPRYDLAADVSGGTFFVKTQSHFVVHEVFATTRFQPQLRGTFGRKKSPWNDMDRRWQMAVWQPHFAIDALRPDDQGLTGFFLNWKGENAEVIGFASPIYIPTMGPEIREEGGSIVSDSRWYRAPSSEFNFNERINSIVYDLDIPDTAKLVTQQSVALSGVFGKRNKGWWSQVSAGYKPVNDLILERSAFKSLTEDVVDVTVRPQVTYHALASVDVGYATENAKVVFSYLQDQPEEKRPPRDSSIQKLMAMKAYSAAVDFVVDDFLERSFAVQMSYLKVDGGKIVDITEDGSPDDITLFDRRQKFNDAVQMRLEGQLASLQRKPLVARLKWLYDFEQQGSLFNTEFLYYPNQKWALVMGADILGVNDEESGSSQFLNQYRANDRVYGGMTYVF